MEIILHYNVLNNKRFSIVKELQTFKKRFYLAGGTGLALQIGHRVSEDFDYFTNVPFNNEHLNSELYKLFPTHKISVIQNDGYTRHCNTVDPLSNHTVSLCNQVFPYFGGQSFFGLARPQYFFFNSQQFPHGLRFNVVLGGWATLFVFPPKALK